MIILLYFGNKSHSFQVPDWYNKSWNDIPFDFPFSISHKFEVQYTVRKTTVFFRDFTDHL